MWRWVAKIARVALDRVGYRETEPDAVDHRVRRHQADRRRAVRERNNSEMPTWPALRINRQLSAFISPRAEFTAWTGSSSDIDA